jgi:hypothetical protein
MSNVPNRSRRTVAAYDQYGDAQRAVDYLSDRRFPVEIVGHGVRYVEQVGGRMTVGRAALLGAAHGAALGVLLGALASIFFALDPSPAWGLLMLYGLVAGALFGAVLGAIAHAATGGRRDFTSAAGMEAERYDVVVDEDVADRAAEILRSLDPLATANGVPESGVRH